MSLQKYTKEWLEQLCKESYSYAEVLRKAGRKQSGGNHSSLKKKIEEFNIDVSHFKGQGWSKGKTCEDNESVANISKKLTLYKIEDIFCEHSPVSRHTIRARIIRENLFEYKCAICGNTGEWMGKEIALQIDHINGVNDDHRLENLRWLCPNCHAATDTYGGKNNRHK